MLNGRLHYPLLDDIGKPLNDTTAEKIREYSADYSNSPSNSISSIPTVATTSGRLHCELVPTLFLQTHGQTDRFFAASGVEQS
jgi:hypothetical protein